MTVFKYLIPERVDVLRAREIRFTQAAALNDPFELSTYFEVLIREDELIRHLVEKPLDITPHLVEAYEKLAPELKAQMPLGLLLDSARQLMASAEGQKVFSETIATALGAMRDVTPKFRDQIAESFKTKIGILSLSELPDSAPMWAHYADQHRGFVIGFDESDTFFNRRRGPEDEFFHLRRVDYRPPEAFADLTTMDGQRILCAKAPEWSYERERRMLVPTTAATRTIAGPTEPIHLMAFPPQAVRLVALGARATPDLKALLDDVLSHADYAHVRLHIARLDDRAMRVTFDPALAL
jgi:hypothetical protein